MSSLTDARAAWSAAYRNDLDDSAFLYIEPGGKKDLSGKTRPRSLRHFPYRDATGAIDLPHLRNVIARLQQDHTGSIGGEEWLSASLRETLLDKAKGILTANDEHGAAPMAEPRAGAAVVEQRFIAQGLEVRANPRGGKTIRGYAAVFDSPSQPLPFIETIDPAAFNRTIKNADVRALGNHDPNFLLGRSKAGTLRLSTDHRGLLYEVDVNEADPDGQRALARVERGDWDGSSFSFMTVRDTWNVQTNPAQRTLLEVALQDVGPVTYPAYLDTTASARAAVLAGARSAHLTPEELFADASDATLRQLVREPWRVALARRRLNLIAPTWENQ